MQVKFRGKRVDGGGWVEGNLIKHIDSLGELWLIEEYIADYTYKKHQVYQSSIGMFTGLTDKRGKEIYGAVGEKGGDVIKTNDRPEPYLVERIHYMASFFPFCKEEINKKGFEAEVIGNATDNPELLEK